MPPEEKDKIVLTDEEFRILKQRIRDEAQNDYFSGGISCGVVISVVIAVIIFILFHVRW